MLQRVMPAPHGDALVATMAGPKHGLFRAQGLDLAVFGGGRRQAIGANGIKMNYARPASPVESSGFLGPSQPEKKRRQR